MPGGEITRDLVPVGGGGGRDHGGAKSLDTGSNVELHMCRT